MDITNAEQATEIARRAIGQPAYFQPIEGKRVNGSWMVRAIIGTVDDIRVTVELPERVVGFPGIARGPAA